MSIAKRKRAYNSPRRRDQAEATRRNILQAARRLFAEQGYSATLAETPAWRASLQNPVPTAQLRQYAANTRHIREQTADIVGIVQGAATADPEIAAMLRGLGASRLKDNHLIAQALARNQALAPGMTVERATDLLWTLSSAEVYRLLVVERGWLPEAYEQWLAAALIEQLLKEPGAQT